MQQLYHDTLRLAALAHSDSDAMPERGLHQAHRHQLLQLEAQHRTEGPIADTHLAALRFTVCRQAREHQAAAIPSAEAVRPALFTLPQSPAHPLLATQLFAPTMASERALARYHMTRPLLAHVTHLALDPVREADPPVVGFHFFTNADHDFDHKHVVELDPTDSGLSPARTLMASAAHEHWPLFHRLKPDLPRRWSSLSHLPYTLVRASPFMPEGALKIGRDGSGRQFGMIVGFATRCLLCGHTFVGDVSHASVLTHLRTMVFSATTGGCVSRTPSPSPMPSPSQFAVSPAAALGDRSPLLHGGSPMALSRNHSPGIGPSQRPPMASPAPTSSELSSPPESLFESDSDHDDDGWGGPDDPMPDASHWRLIHRRSDADRTERLRNVRRLAGDQVVHHLALKWGTRCELCQKDLAASGSAKATMPLRLPPRPGRVERTTQTVCSACRNALVWLADHREADLRGCLWTARSHPAQLLALSQLIADRPGKGAHLKVLTHDRTGPCLGCGSETSPVRTRKSGQAQITWRPFPHMDKTWAEPSLCQPCADRLKPTAKSHTATDMLAARFTTGSTLGRLVQIVHTICAFPFKAGPLQYLTEPPVLSDAHLLATIPHLHPRSVWTGSDWQQPPSAPPSLGSRDRQDAYQLVRDHRAGVAPQVARAQAATVVPETRRGVCICCDAANANRYRPAWFFPIISVANGGGLIMCAPCYDWANPVAGDGGKRIVEACVGLSMLQLVRNMRMLRASTLAQIAWDRVSACGLPKRARWQGERAWSEI